MSVRLKNVPFGKGFWNRPVLVFCLWIVVSSFSVLWAQNSVVAHDTVAVPQYQWKNGEILTYKIGWGFVTAGRTYMQTINSKSDQLHFRWITKSNSTFDAMYKVRDTIHAFADKQTLTPTLFDKVIHEGSWHNRSMIRFKKGESSYFAHLSDTVFTEEDSGFKVKRSTDTVVTVEPNTHCIISAFYHIRTLDLKPGKEYFFKAVSGKKKYDLKVKCYGYETITTDAGTFDCIIVEPLMAGDGVFKGDGKLKIWFTTDERRLPVLMKSKIAVGSIFAELQKIN
jgi:hypothetical protein